jgi:hypothetical protein
MRVSFDDHIRIRFSTVVYRQRCISFLFIPFINFKLTICIPSSVEKIGRDCFVGCQSLSTITFESGSQLSSLSEYAFWSCLSLSSIFCPSSLQTILADYQAVLKLLAAGVPEGDRVLGGADSVEDETISLSQSE